MRHPATSVPVSGSMLEPRDVANGDEGSRGESATDPERKFSDSKISDVFYVAGDDIQPTVSVRLFWQNELPLTVQDVGSRTLSSARDAVDYVVKRVRTASASLDGSSNSKDQKESSDEELGPSLSGTSYKALQGLGAQAFSTASEAVDYVVEKVKSLSFSDSDKFVEGSKRVGESGTYFKSDETATRLFSTLHFSESAQEIGGRTLSSARDAADFVVERIKSAASSLSEIAVERKRIPEEEKGHSIDESRTKRKFTSSSESKSAETLSPQRQRSYDSEVTFMDRLFLAIEERRQEASGFLSRAYSNATASTVEPRDPTLPEFFEERDFEQPDSRVAESWRPKQVTETDAPQHSAPVQGTTKEVVKKVFLETVEIDRQPSGVPDGLIRPIEQTSRNPDQGWLREFVEVLDSALRRDGQDAGQENSGTRDVEEVLSQFSEEIQRRLSENGEAAKQSIQNLGKAYREGDVKLFRKEVANLMDVGGPEVSGAWATVKVGMGLATIITGHALAGAALVVWGTGAVGSAYFWSSNREAVHNWVAGTDDVSRETSWSASGEEAASLTRESLVPDSDVPRTEDPRQTSTNQKHESLVPSQTPEQWVPASASDNYDQEATANI